MTKDTLPKAIARRNEEITMLRDIIRNQEARLKAADALAFAMAHRSLPDQQWALKDYRNAGKGE